MEFVRKITIVLLLVSVLFSCKTVTPAVLLEIKPLPQEVVIEQKEEYEPVFSVMKVLEISEVNGVQKYIIARLEADGADIQPDALGEIAADSSFAEPIGTIKVLSKTGDFLRCVIDTSTHKIPDTAYIRVQIGQKPKEAE